VNRPNRAYTLSARVSPVRGGGGISSTTNVVADQVPIDGLHQFQPVGGVSGKR
jgi:hypothetical protein